MEGQNNVIKVFTSVHDFNKICTFAVAYNPNPKNIRALSNVLKSRIQLFFKSHELMFYSQ